MRFLSFIFLFCIIISSCSNPKKNLPVSTDILSNNDVIDFRGDLYDVSLVKLIASPQIFDGKKVRVIGYLHLEFEGNGLYIHKEDYDVGISKNSIWVDVSAKHPEDSDLKKYSDHYVILEGTFDGKHNGHMSAFSGSIKNISRLEIWPKFADEKSNTDTKSK